MASHIHTYTRIPFPFGWMANTCNILDPLDLMFVTFIALNLLFFCRVGRQQNNAHASLARTYNPTHFKTFSTMSAVELGKE